MTKRASTFALGDIHGCLNALELLFKEHKHSDQDRFVFLGDYVDRGEDVAGVIDFLIALQSEHDCIFLKGNHEIMMKNASLNASSFEFWYRNGGKQTLQSYDLDGAQDWAERLPQAHWEFLDATQPYYEEGHLKFVHASLAPGVPLAQQSSQDIYWKKIDGDTSSYASHAKVLCGHTAQRDGKILNLGHTICIDTCAYGGQWLTMLDCINGRYWQSSTKGALRNGQINFHLPEEP